MPETIGTTGRSTLLGRRFRFVGFCFIKHPTDRARYVKISVYRGEHRWVICLSEGRGKGSPNLARLGLGGEVPGDVIAPFAQRQIEEHGDTLPFDELKRILESGYESASMHSGWEWAENAEIAHV